MGDALRAEEMLALLPAGVARVDGEGRLHEASPALSAMLGRDAEGLALRDALDAASRALWDIAVVPAVRQGGLVDEVQLQLVDAGGRPVPALAYVRRAADALLLVLVPVHARRRLEDELVAVRNAVEQLPGLVFQLRGAGLRALRFDYASGQAGALPGVNRRALLADPAAALAVLHPHDRRRALRGLRRALARREALSFEARCAEDPARWVHVQLRPWARDGGEPAWSGHAMDATPLHQAEDDRRRLGRALATNQSLMRVTLEAIGDAVLTTDLVGQVRWLNPVAERMTGWSHAEAVGRPLEEVLVLVHEADDRPARLAGLREAGRAPRQDIVLIGRDGRRHAIEDGATPLRDDDGELLGMVVVLHDVSEQRALSNEMHQRATHDALTGLRNRGELVARLGPLLAEPVPAEGARHALLFVDLDHFKLVNDSCGHAAGDEVLRQVAAILQQAVRGTDVVARLGGDEFALLLVGCDQAHALDVGRKVCARMEEYRFIHDDRVFRIGASIGLVPVDARWHGTGALLHAADMACYAAKEAGRNRVHAWADSDAAVGQRQRETHWAARIGEALEGDRFVLYGQRVVPLGQDDGQVRVEVLLRLREPDGTILPPAAIIAAAERFNMAAMVDRWVLARTLAWLALNPRQAERAALVTINLSGQSVGDRSFHRDAARLLLASGVDPRRLCFELTETAAVTHLEEAVAFIASMRSLGAKVALDDFGAGASSFAYLRSLPVDLLKIDGLFVKHLLDEPINAVAVKCFVDLAGVLGLQTIAEWVEDEVTLGTLRRLGVDHVQGFLLHRPVPLEQVFGGEDDALAADPGAAAA